MSDITYVTATEVRLREIPLQLRQDEWEKVNRILNQRNDEVYKIIKNLEATIKDLRDVLEKYGNGFDVSNTCSSMSCGMDMNYHETARQVLEKHKEILDNIGV